MHIVSLSGDEPHPSQGSWEEFLAKCERRDECAGTVFYGITNCNYIVFPTGDLAQNYGYHGAALMNRIRNEGWESVLEKIKKCRAEINEIPSRRRSAA